MVRRNTPGASLTDRVTVDRGNNNWLDLFD
ncbi:hypothetical protein J3R03_003422 [Actinoplanes couchii]|nr:hypothetical protein [Actinoplanes couchii]